MLRAGLQFTPSGWCFAGSGSRPARRGRARAGAAGATPEPARPTRPTASSAGGSGTRAEVGRRPARSAPECTQHPDGQPGRLAVADAELSPEARAANADAWCPRGEPRAGDVQLLAREEATALDPHVRPLRDQHGHGSEEVVDDELELGARDGRTAQIKVDRAE